jgi:hypothetical protein
VALALPCLGLGKSTGTLFTAWNYRKRLLQRIDDSQVNLPEDGGWFLLLKVVVFLCLQVFMKINLPLGSVL